MPAISSCEFPPNNYCWNDLQSLKNKTFAFLDILKIHHWFEERLAGAGEVSGRKLCFLNLF